MSMTKRDFEAMAESIKMAKDDVSWDNPDATPDERAAARRALEIAARRLADACAGQYRGGYGFNYTRFMTACGFAPEHSN